MKNEVNRAPWAKKKTFLFILALCAASAAWGTEVTVTVADLAKTYSWTDNTYNSSSKYDLDAVISVNAHDGNNNGKYFSSGSKLRFYTKEGFRPIVISAKEGFVIKSVTFTFSGNNGGSLFDDTKTNQLTTNVAFICPTPAQSVTFYSGYTSSGTTSSTSDVTKFSVTYEIAEPYLTEDFKTPDGEDWSFGTSATSVEGKYYTWTLTQCRYDKTNTNDPTKSHGQGVGMWKEKSSSFVTTAEGGVKAIMFYWNQFAADESSKTDKLAVWLNETAQSNQSITGAKADKRGGDVLCYLTPTTGSAPASWPKNNCELKLTPGGHTGARVTFGPITIVPYLRYTYTETKQVYDDESTFDCSLQIDNTDDEGTISYSSDNPDAVSFADPANPEATIVGGGEATITATWSEASTSFKLKVNVLPVPTVTFPSIIDGKKSVALDVESFTEAATVDITEAPIKYSSSNENVATVDNNGKVTVLTTGTTEITAKVEAKKGEYKEASVTYTLTVTASEASELSFVEKYGNTATWDSYSDDKKIIGTDNIFYWVANNTRRQSSDKIGSDVGLRFRNTLAEGYHLLPDPEHNGGIMEGGIKRIAFKYKEAADGSGVNLEISANSTKRTIKTEPNSGKELPFAANFFVKENTSLKMFNTKGASVVTIGPISIVPYLLFTTKSDEAFLSLVEEYDVKNVLINNTDDGEVVYSILTEGAKSQINDDGVVTFTNVTKSETITIQAAWTPAGESSATVITTMTLYVDVESKTDKTVKEEFSNYGETGWASSEANEVTKNGDVYDWRTQLTRHKTSDKLVDNQQAIWFAQGGYVATADATDNTKVGPAEGGIKRIAFDWNQNAGDQTGDDLYISVSVDGTEMSAIRRDGGARPEQPWQYIHNLNVKKNATLEIENKSTTSKSEGGRVKIGTIVITPYLLYTTKSDEVKLSKGTYVNTNLINNTNGGTITFSAAPEGYVKLQENPTYPGTFELLYAGEVTITATWTPSNAADGEIVTTSYVLKINDKEYMDAHFATAGNFEKVLGNTFTNAVTYTKGEGTVTYSSDNTDVAEVDADGKVTIKGIGTTTIKAHLDETENYFAWDGSYILVVRTGVADDNKLVESFSGISKDASTSETEWKGDLQNYFSWKVKSTRHNGTAGDTIGGAGVAGTVLFAKGQIATDDVIEGGIKYFTFNWKQPYVEAGATLRLTLEAGEESYQQDYVVATDNGSTTHEHLYFAGDMQVKKNVQLILKNESFKTDGGAALTEYGRIAIDKFEIVPYLYYKTKSHVIDNASAGATYINEGLINNIDEGAVTYSLIGEGADDIASIDETGKVTVITGGVVTVQAKWVPDATNEEEFVTTTYTLTINFPAPDVEFTAPEKVALDGTIGETDMHVEVILGGQPVESPSITYTSSNENVIKITNNGWQIIGIGKTTITATVKGTPTYGQVSKTAEIEVTNITPEENTFWKETFSSLGTNSGYDITLTTIEGDNNVLKWKTRNFERNASTDKINGEQGIRLNNDKKDSYSNPGYVEYFTEGDVTSQEGGIKRVQFQWRIPGDQDNKKVVFDVKYKEGDQTVVRTLTYNGIAHATVYDYAQNFNLKNNNKLTIAGSKTSESPVIIGPITIVPYLLYTTKVVEKTFVVDGTNTVDASANLINNLETGETVTYSLSAGAQATISGSTITLANATEDVTVTATWGEVSTTYTLKVTAKEPDFTLENKTAGAFATICLPKKIASVENATLWSINYGDKTAIEFEEADIANDDPGMPYLVQVAADGNVNFYYGEGEAVTEPVPANVANGFVGSLSEGDIEIPNNGTAILISGGRLRIAGAYCVLTQNHAYITTEYLPASAPVGGAPRRTMTLYNPDAAPTNLNGLNGAVKPMKVLRDGQFYILRDTKIYNAQGNLVE